MYSGEYKLKGRLAEEGGKDAEKWVQGALLMFSLLSELSKEKERTTIWWLAENANLPLLHRELKGRGTLEAGGGKKQSRKQTAVDRKRSRKEKAHKDYC